MGYGGSDSLTYSGIKNNDSLEAYWKQLLISGVKLEKPDVDFDKNILVIVQPGFNNVAFKYKISIKEMHDVIEINVSN